MTDIDISLYEALDTKAYRGIHGLSGFDFPGYLETAGELGIKHMRMFADLNYFWNSATEQPKFEYDKAILPYSYLPGKKTFDFDGPLNPEWTARIDEMVKVGRKNLMDFMITGATQGPDYGSPFFKKMGYPAAVNYYDEANFPQFVASGAFARLCKYWRDIWGYLKPFPQRFKIAEPYNEKSVKKDAGMEELKAAKPPRGFMVYLQRPIPSGLKVEALRNLGVDRFSFHGVFTPDDLDAICADAAHFGIHRNEIAAYTDGATPVKIAGKYLFTTADHQAHYKWRINWNKSIVNKNGTIAAHVEIAERAKKLGIALVGFQSVLKWSQLLVWTADATDWAEAILK